MHAQLAELQVCLYTEQRTTTTYQTIVQRHGHITGLQGLDNIILLSFEVQLQVLLVKAERGLRVVTHIEVQLLTYFTIHAELYLLIEVKDIIVSRALCQGWVVNKLVLEAEH